MTTITCAATHQNDQLFLVETFNENAIWNKWEIVGRFTDLDEAKQIFPHAEVINKVNLITWEEYKLFKN